MTSSSLRLVVSTLQPSGASLNFKNKRTYIFIPQGSFSTNPLQLSTCFSFGTSDCNTKRTLCFCKLSWKYNDGISQIGIAWRAVRSIIYNNRINGIVNKYYLLNMYLTFVSFYWNKLICNTSALVPETPVCLNTFMSYWSGRLWDRGDRLEPFKLIRTTVILFLFRYKTTCFPNTKFFFK